MTTLTEFLEGSGARLSFFDLGRRVVNLSRDRFLAFEQTRIPYPLPLQQQAWFALIYAYGKSRDQPSIWFLRLPLDETGCLVQAARDEFMHNVFESIGKKFGAVPANGEIPSETQGDHFTFRPREDRLAIFHAQAATHLQQPASQYYAHAQRYFSGALEWDQWPFLGFQGIADIAARLREGYNTRLLGNAIPNLPVQPLAALCQCLENTPVPDPVAQALARRVTTSLQGDDPDPDIVVAGVRGASYAASPNLAARLLRQVLHHPMANRLDVLAAISGRAWEHLKNPEIGAPYLERLAACTDARAPFQQILADLLFIPGMRQPLLALLRNPQRSETLARAIGELFKSLQTRASG